MRTTSLLLTLSFLGCGDRGPERLAPRYDSESHWLKACVEDAECGTELECLCGVCAAPCEGGCSGAVCSRGAGCGRFCTLACEDDASCAGYGSGLVCILGACVPPMSLPSPPASACTHPDSGCGSDADCGGTACSAAEPETACLCLPPRPPVAVNRCPVPGCCSYLDCPGGTCQRAGFDAQDRRCGAEPPPEANVCVADECRTDADCGEGAACVRAGEHFHVRPTCVPATCHRHDDCAARPGGECTTFLTPCAAAGYHCTYADDPCRRDADCAAEERCLPVGDTTACTPI